MDDHSHTSTAAMQQVVQGDFFTKSTFFFFKFGNASKLRHEVKASKYKDAGKRLHVHTWRIQSTLYLFVAICVTGNNLMSLTIQHQPSSSLCSYGNHTGIWVKATAVGWVLLDKKNLKLILKLHFIVYYLVHVLIFFLLKSCQNSNAFQMVFLSVWMQQTNSWKNIL